MSTTAMDREQIVRSLDWLLAQLHMSLATNKAPDPEVAAIAERIAAWWDLRKSREPLPSLSFNEPPKTTTGDETCWMGMSEANAPIKPLQEREG